MWAPAAVELDASIVPVGVDRILLLLRLFEAVLFTPGDPAPTFLGGQKVVDRTDPNLAMEKTGRIGGFFGISSDPWESEGGLIMSYHVLYSLLCWSKISTCWRKHNLHNEKLFNHVPTSWNCRSSLSKKKVDTSNISSDRMIQQGEVL